MPLGIYLADRIISEKNIYISLILSVLTSLIISFGSYQMVFLFILAMFMYSITQVDFNSLRKYLFIIIVYIFTTFFISLPRLLPTFQSYLRGNRHINGITQTDGSFNPMMTVNLIYPYIFGYSENYKWNTVSSEYQIHETYIYVGITSAITGFFGYFLIKDSKLRKFINLCVLFFLIFGFINYIPFLNTLKIPIISSFRFWGRSVILLVFSVSISAAYFINNMGNEKEFKILKNRFICITFLIFLIQLWFSFYQDNKSSIIIQQVKNRAVQFDTQFNIWLVLLFLTFLSLLLIVFIKYRRRELIKHFLFALIFTDLFYFGHDIVNKYTRNIDELYNKKAVEISEDYHNQRVVILSKDTEYNFGLYLKNWGVLGYSQYNPNLRNQLTKSIGFKETSKQYDSEIDITALDKLGVVKLLSNDGVVIQDFQVNSSLQNFDGIVLEEESLEGEYHFKIKSNSQQKINTFINNHPGWDIKINGILYKDKNKDATFLIFEVPFGNAEIEIKFVVNSL